MPKHAVTIAILNWNGLDVLDQCIDCVKAQTHPEIDLWVLDNASTDGSVEFVKARYPELPFDEFAPSRKPLDNEHFLYLPY